MSRNGEILELLINEDYGLKRTTNPRWAKGEEHDSLVVDKDKGIFYFNSRSLVGSPLDYLTKVRGWSFDTSKEYLKNLGYSDTHTYTIKSDGSEVVVYPPLVDVFYEIGQQSGNRDYMYKRNISDSTLDRFRVGWYNGYTMIPFYMDGSFRNFQMRRDLPVRDMRGYYRGIGPLLFNDSVLNVVDTVYFVEGPIDAMALIQAGLPAISTNSSGLVLPHWYSKFLQQKLIYIVFDNDSAGRLEAKRVAEVLGITRCKIYTFEDLGDDRKGYDPVDFFRDGGTKDEFVALVKENSKYLFETGDYKNGTNRMLRKHSS